MGDCKNIKEVLVGKVGKCCRSERHLRAIEYALDRIRESPLRVFVKRVVLFGSCSRGEEKYDSDIDLLLELDESFRGHPELRSNVFLLRSQASSVEADDVEADLKFVIGKDWESSRMLFYRNIRRDGIDLW